MDNKMFITRKDLIEYAIQVGDVDRETAEKRADKMLRWVAKKRKVMDCKLLLRDDVVPVRNNMSIPRGKSLGETIAFFNNQV